jgi:hypothetical protein
MKIIRPTPDDLGYKDRGKMKWQGLMLSDHTEALKKKSILDAQSEPEPKEKMSAEEISRVLQEAYLTKRPIIMQADVVTDGHYYEDMLAMVKGYYEDRIYFKLKDGRDINCTIEEIRNVELGSVVDWYEKK